METSKDITPLVRFIPKVSDMRPIYPIKNAGFSMTDLIKMRLLLSVIIKCYESSLVSSKSRINYIGGRWSKYIAKLRKNNHFSSHLYIVKLDVADAFGSVEHNLLIQLLQENILKLPLNIYFGEFVSVSKKGEFSRKKQYLQMDDLGNCYSNSAVVETGPPMTLTTRKILLQIKQYISEQYVTAGPYGKYRVAKGIAQGGALSSSLCDLYYSALYHLHWRPLVGDADFAIHCVDDFLYCTTNKDSAIKFLNTTSKGVEQFCCVINPSKTIHNICESKMHIRVPFCGVTLCSASKQILVSVGQSVSCPPRYSMVLKSHTNAGQYVCNKLKTITRARVSTTVFHPEYTTVAGLLANAYRIGFLTGSRLEALCSTLLPRSDSIKFNSGFLELCIKETARETSNTIIRIWRRCKNKPPLSHNVVNLSYIGEF